MIDLGLMPSKAALGQRPQASRHKDFDSNQAPTGKRREGRSRSLVSRPVGTLFFVAGLAALSGK